MADREHEHPPTVRSVLAALAADLRGRHSPLTGVLVACICVTFLGQTTTAFVLDASVRTVTAGLFLERPVTAWLLSVFMHRGVEHLLANVIVVAVAGRVLEGEFSPGSYLGFLAVAAVLSGVGGYLSKATFTARPVAAYGASGIAFALATYGLTLPFARGGWTTAALDPERLLAGTTPGERVAVLLGVAALVTVTVDVATGPYLSVAWLNGAHLVGAVVGLATGVLQGR